MENLDGVVVFSYAGDFWQTKICVASIRYWYPEFPIYIFKDKSAGDFNSKDLTKYWNVNLLELNREKIGSPFSKVFINFLNDGKKYLVLDSDVAFVGHVLEKMNNSPANFIVHKERGVDPTSNWFSKAYYDYGRIKKMDENFTFPGFSFNTGAIVVTTGVLSQKDFEDLVCFEGKVHARDPLTFPLFDQSIYNYLLPKWEEESRLSLEGSNFMLWGHKQQLTDLSFNKIQEGKSQPYLIHWAGTVKPLLRKMDGGEILEFYRKFYYSRIPFGSWRYTFRRLTRELRWGFPYLFYKSIRGNSYRNTLSNLNFNFR